jgi:hypothetical protein
MTTSTVAAPARRQEMHRLVDLVMDGVEQPQNAQPTQTQADQPAFEGLCALAKVLGPELSRYLEADALAAVGGKLPPRPGTDLGQAPAPREHKIYTGQIIARLLYGLRDAIGNAFPGGESGVAATIQDLLTPQSTSRLLPDRTPGDQRHGFRSEKQTAQALVFEIINFEQARLGHKKWTDTADHIFGHGRIAPRTYARFRGRWKKMNEPQGLTIQGVRAQGVSATGEHPDLIKHKGQLDRLIELATKR